MGLLRPLPPFRLSLARQDAQVKAGTWFGCFPSSGVEYSLVGCTVAPGFQFEDFELGSRATLLKEFPAASDLVEKLTVGLP